MSPGALGSGIGLRAPHHAEFLASCPRVGWVEVHSENHFARGGTQREVLAQVRELYPVSLHGVGLSVGSTDPIDDSHVAQLVRLVRDLDPVLVSEHLAWGSVDGRFVNDLLPLPYTEEALQHTAARVGALQDALGRQVLIENTASYLEFTDSQMTEWEFLATLAAESGCGILLDVNNLYVNAMNHGFDPHVYLRRIPRGAVQEMHLAGHSVERVGAHTLLLDAHDAAVSEAVWQLYRVALERFGPVRTLIEWDADLPPLAVLLREATQIGHVLAKAAQ